MKISIITINYNNLIGLKKTVDSVINQTSQQVEYIIIDGGSTDGSAEYIQEHSNNFHYWVTENDKGIYNAMNKGIAKANGDYVFFLNSGDCFFDNTVVDNFISFHPTAAIVYGNLVKVYPDETHEIDKGLQKSNLTLGDIFLGNLNHQATFIKKTLFEKYGGYKENYKVISDWAFLLLTIGINSESSAYYDFNISYFDMTGICNSKDGTMKSERDIELKNIVPAYLYTDYKRMGVYRSKATFYDKLEKHRVIWLLIRLYNKITNSKLWG